MCTIFIITAPWDNALPMDYVYMTMKLAALRITRVVTMAGTVTVDTQILKKCDDIERGRRTRGN